LRTKIYAIMLLCFLMVFSIIFVAREIIIIVQVALLIIAVGVSVHLIRLLHLDSGSNSCISEDVFHYYGC